LQNELAEMYRNRKDNLKVGITERLKKIEEMEQKETHLMQRLQTTI